MCNATVAESHPWDYIDSLLYSGGGGSHERKQFTSPHKGRCIVIRYSATSNRGNTTGQGDRCLYETTRIARKAGLLVQRTESRRGDFGAGGGFYQNSEIDRNGTTQLKQH